MRTIVKTPTLKSLFDANFYPATLGNVLDEFYGNNKKSFVPAVNVTEDEEKFTLEILVPGFTKEDLKVDLNENLLTISADHKEESTKAETSNYVRKEFSHHSFERSFTLPENTNKEALAAKYENGILNVSIPKKVEAKVEVKKLIDIA
jgi:HSP20 family protein